MSSTAEVVADLAGEQLAGQLVSRQAMDSKAGVLIGLAGLVVGLLALAEEPALHAAAGLAATSGLAALTAFWPRRFLTVDAEAFAAVARAGVAVDISLLLARQRSVAIVANQPRLTQKVWLLRVAAALLVLSAGVAAFGRVAGG